MNRYIPIMAPAVKEIGGIDGGNALHPISPLAPIEPIIEGWNIEGWNIEGCGG